MLKQLRIQNIILIESADIPFEAGLNVLSGETGSGKSAIMEALKLVLGERADTGLIRLGCDKGTVEALFEIDSIPQVAKKLEDGGIEFSPNDPLIIRREIYINGKSRAFVNNQMAQLAFLRTLGELLVDVIGQHANQRLRTTENHRELLDTFADLESLRHAFSQAWTKENVLENELSTLISQESQRLREIEIKRMELEELREANLKEGEEEELFSQYTLLSNSEERMQKITELNKILSEDKISVIVSLRRCQSTLEALTDMDSSLVPTLQTLTSAALEFEDVVYTLRTYQSRIDFNPTKTQQIHERLSQINRLKRKYGSTLTEILTYQADSESRLQVLENADIRIEELRSSLTSQKALVSQLAAELTGKRTLASSNLAKSLVVQLRSLNMPKVEFHIQITSQKRNSTGDDKVEFFLAPNIGEHRISICDSASGGELSRVMLALQTVLAGKTHIATLVFDEVDANIGGETATIIGDKLKQISVNHQVICITHFPQVASHAHHHLQISKKEIDGRTLSIISPLTSSSRRKEILRMLGGVAP